MITVEERIDIIEQGIKTANLQIAVLRRTLKNVAASQSLSEAKDIATSVLTAIDAAERASTEAEGTTQTRRTPERAATATTPSRRASA